MNKLNWFFAGILLISVSLIAATDGGSEVGVRQLVRSTAQFGVVLFAFAFSASSLRTFWRTPFSAWLLKNRRYVGLSFAPSRRPSDHASSRARPQTSSSTTRNRSSDVTTPTSRPFSVTSSRWMRRSRMMLAAIAALSSRATV